MRIRTRSIILTVSSAVTHAVAVVTVMILVRLISKEDFGSYRQVLLVAGFIVGLVGLDLPGSLFYFIPKLGLAKRRLVVTQTLGLAMIVAAGTAAAMYFGAGPIAVWMNNPALESLLRVFCLFPFASLVLSQLPPFMISVDRPLAAGTYTLLAAVFRVAPLIVATATGESLETALRWLVISCIGLALIGTLDMYRLSPRGKQFVDGRLILMQLSYVWPMLAASLVAVLSRQFDKLIISMFFDPEDYAVYSCGAVEVPLIGILSSSIAAAIMPNMVSAWEKGDKAGALALWMEAVRKTSLVVYPAFAICAVSAADLMVLLFTQAYRAAAWPFLVYLLDLPVRVAVYGAVLRSAGKTRPIAVSAALGLAMNAVVGIALVYLGRKAFPETILAFVAPAVGSTAAIYAGTFYLLICISKASGRPLRRVMPWKDLGHAMAVGLGAAIPTLALPLGGLPVEARLAIRGAAFAVLLLVLVYATRLLRPDEKELLWLPLHHARRLFRRPAAAEPPGSDSGKGKP